MKKQKKKLYKFCAQRMLILKKLNYDEYCAQNMKYYTVYQSGLKRVLDFAVSQPKFGFLTYSMVFNGKQVSRHVRKNAIFYAPWTRDIMDVYRELRLRYLIQKSKNTRTK